jgi:hypothetical protein
VHDLDLDLDHDHDHDDCDGNDHHDPDDRPHDPGRLPDRLRRARHRRRRR